MAPSDCFEPISAEQSPFGRHPEVVVNELHAASGSWPQSDASFTCLSDLCLLSPVGQFEAIALDDTKYPHAMAAWLWGKRHSSYVFCSAGIQALTFGRLEEALGDRSVRTIPWHSNRYAVAIAP